MRASTRLKNQYRTTLKRAAWSKEEFQELSAGKPSELGTQSKRKLPANCATNCGAHGEEVEIRGRWKGTRGGKIVNRYIDVKQLFQDVKVEQVLAQSQQKLLNAMSEMQTLKHSADGSFRYSTTILGALVVALKVHL
jgi:hypothetical protein